MDTIQQRNELELDFHHLQFFDVLMTEHSITKASRVLNLTQPALNRTLARLQPPKWMCRTAMRLIRPHLRPKKR